MKQTKVESSTEIAIKASKTTKKENAAEKEIKRLKKSVKDMNELLVATARQLIDAENSIVDIAKIVGKLINKFDKHPFNVERDGTLRPDEIYLNFKYRLIALEETTTKILAKLGMEND